MKAILTTLLLIISFQSISQINVGSNFHPALNAGILDTNQIEQLKKSHTIFVYRDVDTIDLKNFKEQISSIWTISELEFYSYDEFLSEQNGFDESYSFITIVGDLKIRTSTSQNGATMESLICSIFLNVWKLEKGIQINYARIELFPSFSTAKMSKQLIKNSSVNFSRFVYKNSIGVIYNWNTGYIKNALQYVNNSLLKNEDHWMMESVKSDELKNLSNNTLYVSDEILIKYNYFKDTENEKHNEIKLFKSYRYKYKILTKEELSEKIQDESPIYYLTYIKSETRKYLIVMNSVTGEIVYSQYEGNSHNIESKDLAKLAKVIKKKSK